MNKKEIFLEQIKVIISYIKKNELIEAERITTNLLKKNDKDVGLINIYATILIKLNKRKESIKNLFKSIKLNPNFHETYFILSKVYYENNDLDNATKYAIKCVSIKADNENVLILLGQIYFKKEEKDLSIKYFQKAIDLNKSNWLAYYNLGVLFQKYSEYKNSIHNYKLSIKYNSNNYASHNNLGNVYQELGYYELASKHLAHTINLNPKFVGAYSNYLYCLNFIESFDQKIYFKIASKFTSNLETINFDRKKEQILKKEKINLGFVSGDFGIHPVSFYLVKLIELINKKKFCTYAYSNSNKNDLMTNKLKKNFNNWRQINKINDKEVLNQIQNDRIDILIDLSGHTGKNRLSIFARRAAPIQITWLGFNASTGLKEMDYIIVDPYVFKNEHKGNFSEKAIILPDTFQCIYLNDKVKIKPKKQTSVVFGNFSKLSKINDNVIVTWAQILKKIKNSKIFLKNKQFESNEVRKEFILKFKKLGIGINRIILEGRSKTRLKMLERYNEIDIILDTFPYPGITTSLESIFMGVPLLTKNGSTYYSKIGTSINKNLNMTDWIADNNNEYIQKAIKKSYEIKNSLNNKKKLRNNFVNSPLFDSNRFTKNFERALINISKINY